MTKNNFVRGFMLVMVALSCLTGRAEDTAVGTDDVFAMLQRTYRRPTLAIIYTGAVVYEEKMGWSGYESNLIQLTNLSSQYDVVELDRTYYQNKTVDEVMEYSGGIARQLMEYWFPTFDEEKGEYSCEKLYQKGLDAATVNDVKLQDASYRKQLFYMLGEQLIDRTYVLVIECSRTKNMATPKVRPVLYKLNFSDEVRTRFYENYFNKEDGIRQMGFDLQLLKEGKRVTFNPNGTETATSYAKVLAQFKKVPDMMLQSTVTKAHPIKAALDKGDGLKRDMRFSVMELQQKKDGTLKAVRKATVRAKRVRKEGENAFFQTSGKRVKPGLQTLVQSPGGRVSLVPEYSWARYSLALQWRLPHKPLLMYFKVSTPRDEDGKVAHYKRIDDDSYKPKTKHLGVFTMGLGREFNFGRSFCFTPSVGWGFMAGMGTKERSGKESPKNSNQLLMSWTWEGSLELGYNFSRHLQLFAEGGILFYTARGQVRRNFNYTYYDRYATYGQKPGLRDGFNAGVGLKITF